MEKSGSSKHLVNPDDVINNGKELLEAQAHLWNHIFSFANSVSLYSATQLGIPDIIHSLGHGKPITLSQLISSLPINHTKAPGIFRLMRILVHSGFFGLQKLSTSASDHEEEGYVLTDYSRLLLKDNPLNSAPFLLAMIDPLLTHPWHSLTTWFNNDDATPFATSHGKCKDAITSRKSLSSSAGNKKGKVIIVDMVLENQKQDKASTQTQLLFDVMMLGLLPGKERTEKEWAKLFADAGFTHYKITPLGLRCTLSRKITLPIRTSCPFMAGNGANGFKCVSSSSQFALAYLNSCPTSSDDEDLESSTAAATSSSSCLTTQNIHHSSSELDTIRVVEKLRSLGTKPKDAFLFFHEVKRAGFQHNVSTYAVLVAVLCSWGLDRMLDSLFLDLIEHPPFQISELLEKLREELVVGQLLVRAYDALVKSFVSVAKFDDAIDVLFSEKRCGLVPHIFTCNFLMNRLTKHGKMDMAIAIYMQLKSNGLRANDYTYAIVIKAHCKKGSLEEAAKVFLEMEESGVTPGVFAYTTYIEGLCVNKSSAIGYQVLQKLIAANNPIDMYAYTAVIRGFCNEAKLAEAERVFLDMEKLGIVPDLQTYGAMINGYCNGYNLVKALALHDDMVLKGIKTNCVIISMILQCLCKMGMHSEVVNQFNKFNGMGIYLDEISHNIVLDALCKLGQAEQAVELFEKMKGKKLSVDIKHYTTLINGYCLKGNLGNALNLMDEMKEKGFKPDNVTYNVLAAGFFRNGLTSKVLLDYMEAEGIKPDSVIHKMIIENLFKRGKVEEAELFFNCLKVKSQGSCSAMINGYCDADNTRKAYKLAVRLSTNGALASKNSYYKLLSKLCMNSDHKSAEMLLNMMLDSNAKPTKIFYDKLIASLCQTKDVQKARRIFNDLVKKGLTPDIINYTMLINSYCKVDRLQEAYNLFLDMKQKGIQPDITTYTVLLDAHLKTETMEKKEAIGVSPILTEMQEMEIRYDAIYYTVFIDYHSKKNNIENAISFFNEMIERGVEPDTVAFTALVLGCFPKGNLSMAVTVFNKIIENEMITQDMPADADAEIRRNLHLDLGERLVQALCLHALGKHCLLWKTESFEES
ncbi:hypothetical protein FEM48_Zijuj05G0188500 [Ziziphus jujuba var. spinosa]|uniref:Pentatricopeptide repeat-containing protein At2g26790, mitochondrial-like n=1 Tax=Ziziphus jujuba var. spinosa TaxID=714518 RepID=A0A978VGJ2_ZIZJJ|nr:hypothetical protein FEM48_Zijuj05G0188500 [Ziziphus jujuba var. spinosa]